MKDKLLVGLTGLYCAGKNHTARLLEKRGLPVLDVDKLGHEVIETEKTRLTARFGTDILGSEGFIDRKKLGAKVFGRPEELAALEGIIHPAVNRETRSWIDAQKARACVINAALLHRSSAFNDLDAVLLVEAPFLVRLVRAKKRDRLPLPVLIKRFRSQNNFTSQYFQGKTDIYRVSNPSGCLCSGCFGFANHFSKNGLENRIDEILSLLGITDLSGN